MISCAKDSRFSPPQPSHHHRTEMKGSEDEVNDSGRAGIASLSQSPQPTGLERTRPSKRRNFCPFCEKLLTNLSRHMLSKHPDVDGVKKYMALGQKSPKTRRIARRRITDTVRHVGNHMYNNEIIGGNRKEELVPAKRSSRPVSNITHVVCKHCLGLFQKESLFKHLANCDKHDGGGGETTSRDSLESKRIRRILNEHAKLLVIDNKHANNLLKTEVFPKMQKDLRTVVAQSDSMICRYGSDFRFTHRGARQVRYCSSKMRSLAQLFLAMKEITPEIKDFSECIRPRHFNTLTEAVRRISRFDIKGGETKAPSVPARLCSSLKRCANINKSEAIKSETLTRSEKTEIICEMNDFLHLMEKDWATEVGTNSENSRRRKKVVKEDLLPEPEDIRRFNEYIHGLCPCYVTELELAPTANNYEKLAKLAIVHIITLNRRRPNETVEITKEAYHSTLNKRLDYETRLQSGVTEEELKSGEELAIFYVAASKNLRKVPVLLTKVFHSAIDALIDSHEKLGINSRYIFARPGSTELYDGSSVLREIANKAGLKNPSTFTANALRHHAATSSQLHVRNDTYTKRLSTFLGHDLRTHEMYYDLPLPLVQRSVVGHRLLEMVKKTPAVCTETSGASGPSISTAGIQTLLKDSADASRSFDDVQHTSSLMYSSESDDAFAGITPPVIGKKSTSNTTMSSAPGTFTPALYQDLLDDLSPTRSGIDGDTPSGCSSLMRTPPYQLNEVTKPRVASQSPEAKNVTPRENVLKTDPMLSTPPRGSGSALAESVAESEESSLFETPPRKVFPKRKWSENEKKVIYRRFRREIVMKMKPSRSDIKTFWENEPTLKNRTLPQVVTYVNNILGGKHRIPTPTRRRMKKLVRGRVESPS